MSDSAEIQMFQQAQRLPVARRGEFALAYHTQRKDRSVAFLLSFFLGMWGVDRFYLGHVGLGIAKLFGSWFTFGLWWFVDLFLIMRAADRYNAGIVAKLSAMYMPALANVPTREQTLLELGTRRGGVTAAETAHVLGVSVREADSMLTALAKREPDRLTVDVDDQGIVRFRTIGQTAEAFEARLRVESSPQGEGEPFDEAIAEDERERAGRHG